LSTVKWLNDNDFWYVVCCVFHYTKY